VLESQRDGLQHEEPVAGGRVRAQDNRSPSAGSLDDTACRSRREVVAQYLGDKLTTVLTQYVRAGEDVLRDSVSKLEYL
jgi:hypothetical protein